MGAEPSSDKKTDANFKDFKEEKISMYDRIETECNHITKICSKHKDLEKLRLKLRILELKFFAKTEYSPKCGHINCKNKAPKLFPKCDVYSCPKHLSMIKDDFDKRMTNKLMYQIKSINKPGESLEKNIINSVYHSYRKIGSSFNGSINNVSKQPKGYWSLLMTKLVTMLSYLKLSQVKSTQQSKQKIDLLNNLLKLMILYRCVMNPIGLEILAFITEITSSLYSIMFVSTHIVVDTLAMLLQNVSNSVLFGYAAIFVPAMIVAYGAANNQNINGDNVAKHMIRTGVITAAAGLIGGLGLIVGGSMILLLKAFQQNPGQNAIAAADDLAQNWVRVNVEPLQRNDDIDDLRRQLQELEEGQ
eukprot:539466_1